MITKKFKILIEIIKEEGFKNGFKKSIKFILNIFTKILIKIYFNIIKRKKYQFKEEFIDNPSEVVYIPTHLINREINSVQRNKYNYKYNFNFRRKCNAKDRIVGLILDGSWDLNNKENNTLVLKAFKERYLEKKEWEKTVYFKIFKITKKNKKSVRKCKNFKEFKEKKLYQWDKLYKDIKETGYKSQKEIHGKSSNEIEIAISRKGEILFIDGRHRLVIAKILGIKEVPVIINVWHKEYIDWLKNNIDIKDITPKTAIQPILNRKLNDK